MRLLRHVYAASTACATSRVLAAPPWSGGEHLPVAVDAPHRRLQPLRLGAHLHVLQHQGSRQDGRGGFAMPLPAMSGAEPWTDSK